MRFWRWIVGVLSGSETVPKSETRQDLPPVIFTNVRIVEKAPKNEDIASGQFYAVVYKGTLHWTSFRCPCGCQEVISLPMQHPHSPKWSLNTDDTGKPTLYPSVWRNKGCLSHFWLRDGRVYWCADTGNLPWKMRPDLYQKR